MLSCITTKQFFSILTPILVISPDMSKTIVFNNYFDVRLRYTLLVIFNAIKYLLIASRVRPGIHGCELFDELGHGVAFLRCLAPRPDEPF